MDPHSLSSYARQQITDQDIDCVVKALQGELISRGPCVEAFEQEISSYCGASYAVAFNSGTSALHAAYFAARVTSYDRVITTANTFFGTVCGAVVLGAAVQCVDIDPLTGNLDLEQLRLPRLSRGRPILVPIHFTGTAVEMQKLGTMVEEPDAVIIEDGCQALGSTYPDGKRVGCCEVSDMTVFSFHPSKTITTGEGGMVVTNREEYAKRLRLFRNNGLVEGKAQSATGNFHLTDFQAALGSSQLTRIETMLTHRQELFESYQKELSSLAYVHLLQPSSGHSAHNLLVVRINFKAYGKTREEVIRELKQRGIGTQLHHTPLYRHPVFQDRLEDLIEAFPQMELYAQEALTLPLFMQMSSKEVQRCCQTLKEVLQGEGVAAKELHKPSEEPPQL